MANLGWDGRAASRTQGQPAMHAAARTWAERAAKDSTASTWSKRANKHTAAHAWRQRAMGETAAAVSRHKGLVKGWRDLDETHGAFCPETMPVSAADPGFCVVTRQARLEQGRTYPPAAGLSTRCGFWLAAWQHIKQLAQTVADSPWVKGCAAAAAAGVGAVTLLRSVVAAVGAQSTVAVILSSGMVVQMVLPALLLLSGSVWGLRMMCKGAQEILTEMSTPERGATFGAMAGLCVGLLVAGAAGVVPGCAAGLTIGTAVGLTCEAIHQARRLWAWATGGDPSLVLRLEAGLSLKQQFFLCAGIALVVMGVVCEAKLCAFNA